MNSEAGGSKRARILILDGHAVFRDALGFLLAAEPDFEVAGKCGSVDEAVGFLMPGRVDLVLLDLDLNGVRAAGFCRLAQEMGFTGKVLVLTAGIQGQELVQLLAEGASGVFLKHSSAEALPGVIRKVIGGRTWIDPRLAPERPDSKETEPMRRLSPRERQVMVGLLEGLGNKQIAARLDVSENAVKWILQQLFTKLGVQNRVQVMRLAMRYIGETVHPAASNR